MEKSASANKEYATVWLNRLNVEKLEKVEYNVVINMEKSTWNIDWNICMIQATVCAVSVQVMFHWSYKYPDSQSARYLLYVDCTISPIVLVCSIV